MKERILVLLGEMESVAQRQARLYERLDRSWERYRASREYGYLVETAFYLNQIYSGYEKIFFEVAEVFENTIDTLHWHKSLLERMRLSLEGLRPALISEETFRCLNELRAFRHFFRHAYDTDLEPEKVELVVRKALRLKDLWAGDYQAFKEFLRALV
ncbi:MAG: ribonuclease toxin HepT-like protein [Desulfotomaculales bacterium]